MKAFVTWLIVVSTLMRSCASSEDHACPKFENYTVTSMEMYTEPVVVNTFAWCLQIPPRCPQTRTEMRQRYRVKEEIKTRKVKVCCEGYKMVEARQRRRRRRHDQAEGSVEAFLRCEPVCDDCRRGVCVSPNACRCDSGFHGGDCSLECPPGSWGMQCARECDCAPDVTCDPVSGTCRCPPGLRGTRCTERCPNDRWGPQCLNPCRCKNPLNACHPETGDCKDDDDDDDNENDVVSSIEASPTYSSTSLNELRASTSDAATETSEDTSELTWTTEYLTTGSDARVSSPDVADAATENRELVPPTSIDVDTKTIGEEDEPSTTARPVIVLVSVPERGRVLRKDRPEYALKGSLLRHFEQSDSLRNDVPPKTGYVKTIRKDVETATPLPVDITLIVVASIVSLGLTSVAVVMIIHMRSRLLETMRLSIYDDEKSKHQQFENERREQQHQHHQQQQHHQHAGRTSKKIVGSALPQIPMRASSIFAASSDPVTLPLDDDIESTNGYANGIATIGLRISDLRDLLQDGHYDRPPTTLIRLHTDFDANTEHLYDEIPMQSAPFCERKDA